MSDIQVQLKAMVLGVHKGALHSLHEVGEVEKKREFYSMSSAIWVCCVPVHR